MILVRRFRVPPLNRLMPLPEAVPPSSVHTPPAMFMIPGAVAVRAPPNALFSAPLNDNVPVRVSMSPAGDKFKKLKPLIALVPLPPLLRKVPALIHVMLGPPYGL